MGMKLLQKRANMFYETSMMAKMGYGDSLDEPHLEFVYQYGTQKLEHGNSFKQLVISTPNVHKATRWIKKNLVYGAAVEKEPEKLPNSDVVASIIRDPNDYAIMLVDAEAFKAET
eukprot:Platyproteum_vivax@DN7028_c0_g1_i2.p2